MNPKEDLKTRLQSLTSRSKETSNPEEDLKVKLQRLASRSKTAKNWQLLGNSILSLCIVCILVGLLTPEKSVTQGQFFKYSLGILAATYFAVRLYLRKITIKSEDIVSQLEQNDHNLDERLYTAYELLKKEEKLNVFEKELIREVLEHDKKVNWEKIFIPKPPETLRNNFIFGTIVFIILSQSMSSKFPATFKPMNMTVQDNIVEESLNTEFKGLEVQPGNTEIAKGKSLLITARFNNQLPTQVTLFAESKNSSRQIKMKKSLGDPVFASSIDRLTEEIEYWLEFSYEGIEYSSERFVAKVFDYPKLETLQATLKYPAYLNQPDKILPDTRLISAIQGTDISLEFTFNKDIAKVYLENKDDKIELSASGAGNVFSLSKNLKKSAMYKIIAIDKKDRQNLFPPTLTFKVYSNSKPKFKIKFPSKDLRISPLAELDIRATIKDDVELLDYGIEFDFKDESKNYSAKNNDSNKKSAELNYAFKFEDMQAKPNEMISWRLWAKDTGNDGKERTTYTDIYFIEFRHLEEIAREMQSSGQPMEGAEENDDLIKLQKDIISATWKKLNSVDLEDFSEAVEKDLKVIEESQRKAIELADGLLLKLPPKLQTYVRNAQQEMQKAAESLKGSYDENNKQFLSDALDYEQKALRHLLQLNSKLKNIMQSQSQGKSKSKKNEDLKDRLNLEKMKKQRYETKKDPQREQQRQQERDILNALKELAQRQMDLNEQIKKLQAELAKENDKKKQQELERQLKRLMEEQQELVRDAEKLQEKMNQESTREQMAKERQKMEEIKEQMQRTAEDLKERRLQDSINSGKRTERNLTSLKDEVKKKTASEFQEELRELKKQANELQEKISEIKKDSEKAKEQKPSLSAKGDQEELADRLKESSEDMQKLLEDLKETTKNSEDSQAATSRELYEALRKSHMQDTKGTLDKSERLMRDGFKQQAQEETDKAEKEVSELSRAIDKASEKILGDEKEGLQKAQSELDKLQKDLAGKAGKKGKDDRSKESGDRKQEAGKQSGQGKEGQQQAQNGKEGQQPGQEQQGNQGQGNQQGQQAQNREKGKGDRSQEEGKQPGKGKEGQQQAQNGKEGQSGKDGKQSEQGQQGQQGEGQQAGEQGKGQQAQNGKERNQGQGNQQGNQQAQNGKEGQQGQASPTHGGSNNGGMSQLNNFDGPRGKPREFKEMIGDLRNIEDLLQDQNLRQKVASVRDRMRQMEMDKKRFSKKPTEEQIRKKLYQPLAELQKDISEELAKMNDTKGKVRMDKDPIPEKFEDQVRDYFQRLGKGSE